MVAWVWVFLSLSGAFWFFDLLSTFISDLQNVGHTCTHSVLNRGRRTPTHFAWLLCRVAACHILAGIQKVLKGTSHCMEWLCQLSFQTWRLPVLENGGYAEVCSKRREVRTAEESAWIGFSVLGLYQPWVPRNKKNSSWGIVSIVHLLSQHWLQRQLLGCCPSSQLFHSVFAWSANMWDRCWNKWHNVYLKLPVLFL